MKRLLAVAAVAAAVLCQASSAQAAIHPIMVGWVCGSASGNPPGQTPGETHSDQSTFRAIQSTGYLTLTNAGPVLDTSVPASKFPRLTRRPRPARPPTLAP